MAWTSARLRRKLGRIDTCILMSMPTQRRAGLAAMAMEHGLRRLLLSSSLNAVPVYERAGYVAPRREIYPHRSGIRVESVYMEKTLPGG